MSVEPILQPTWQGNAYLESYVQTLKALRALDKPQPVDFATNVFKNGPLTIFGWDLSADRSNYSPCRRGVTSMELRFAKPTPAVGLTAIVMGQFHGMMTIDKNHTVNVFDRIYGQ